MSAKLLVLVSVVLLAVGPRSVTHAEDAAPVAATSAVGNGSAAPAEEPSSESSESGESAPTAGGKKYREKDIEGTQAPNRFEADPIIKSKYQLNGEPLEVDPD